MAKIDFGYIVAAVALGQCYMVGIVAVGEPGFGVAVITLNNKSEQPRGRVPTGPI